MISAVMNARLNDQIAAEFAAAHAYLAMSCAFDGMALKVLAQRFLKQHDEEREHAMKILHYVQEVGGTVSLEAVAKPKKDYKNAEAIVSTALQNEKDITTRINDLMTLAESEKDYATRSFLQWFIDEQVREVAALESLINKIKLVGLEGSGLFMLDKKFGAQSA